ncbi:MAG TPA: phage tail tape measure protein [Alphaproteobacteria bacterium]|nr:phage tail tape measure protein [Alphaproteobacteria bacterium]
MAETVVGIKIQAIDEISGKIDEIKSKFSGLSSIGDTFVNAGKQMAVMGAAITVPFVAAVKTFSDFEQKMKDVQVVSGATEEDFEMLTNAAKKIGETTKFSASEAAEGLYSLASAGLEAEEQVSALKSVTDLAAATNSDFASTSATIVSTVNQFGLAFEESSRVSDVFAKATNESQATMSKLAASMRNAGAIASTLGMEIEDTTSYLMLLYDTGHGGEQVGTMIKSALSQLINPSNEAKAALEGIGVSMKELQESTDPLRVALDALEESGGDSATIMKIFGQEAGPGVAALLKKGTAALDEYEAGLRDSAGTAKKMADEQMNTLEGMMKVIKSKIEGVMIEVGQAVLPIVETIADAVSGMIDAWNGVPEPIRNAITQFTAISGLIITVGGGITALIGGIMKSVTVWKTFGTAVKGVAAEMPLLQAGIEKVKTSFSGLQASLATGIKLAGIAALLVAIDQINSALKDMATETITVVDGMNEKMGGIVDTSKNWYESLLSMIPLIGGIGDTLHSSRISSDLAEITKRTGENTDAFVVLALKARDAADVNFSKSVNGLIGMATETEKAGGMFQQFGTHVDVTKKALAGTILEMEKQGESTEELRAAWGNVIEGFDSFINTEKETMALAEEISTQLIETGESGSEAAKKMIEGLDKVNFDSVTTKASEFVTDIAQIMADGGTQSKDQIMANLKEVDFTFLANHAQETATKLLESFKAAGADSLTALKNINTLSFDTLELTFSETANKAREYFELAGKDAARGLGVVNDMSFSTLDDKVTNISNDFMRTFTDAGIDSKFAMEVINDVDFSGLKPTTEETKDELVKIFEKAGYSSQEALEKVNEIDLEELVKKSQSMGEKVQDQYKSAVDKTLAEFQKLNEYKFSQLQQEVDSFSTANARDEVDLFKAKINEVDGMVANVTIKVTEVKESA